MEIYGLSGESGTGKSTSALSLAYEKKIPAIVDDGLLIFNGERVSGTSAKYENNAIRAVKRATFYYDDHAAEVQKTISLLTIDKILILGTSVKMVDLIASKLHLGEINHYINIRDIRASSEIKLALFKRKTSGSHLMPIPYTQVEKNFFKRILSQGMKIFSPKKEMIGETTIVRPNFHRNSIEVSDQVFKVITSYCCMSFEEVFSCGKIDIQLEGLPSIHVELNLHYQPGKRIIDILEKIQQKIGEDFENHLNIELYAINMHVLKLV